MRSEPRLPDPEVNLPKEHPLHEAGVLIAGVAALFVVAFLVVTYFVDGVVLFLPPEAEARVLSMPDFDDGEERHTQERAQLQQLLEELAQGWEGNPYKFSLSIRDEELPNAFALPGGHVVVTRGLLDRAGSENELAMVLGHELGHFKNRDHLRALGRGLLFSLLLAGAGFGGDNAVVSTTSGLMTLSYGRKQESRADAFGLRLLAAHYGHVAGCGDFFTRMAQEFDAAESLPAFIRSHPRSGDRAAALHKLATRSGYPLQGELSPWPPTGD